MREIVSWVEMDPLRSVCLTPRASLASRFVLRVSLHGPSGPLRGVRKGEAHGKDERSGRNLGLELATHDRISRRVSVLVTRLTTATHPLRE